MKDWKELRFVLSATDHTALREALNLRGISLRQWFDEAVRRELGQSEKEAIAPSTPALEAPTPWRATPGREYSHRSYTNLLSATEINFLLDAGKIKAEEVKVA